MQPSALLPWRHMLTHKWKSRGLILSREGQEQNIEIKEGGILINTSSVELPIALYLKKENPIPINTGTLQQIRLDSRLHSYIATF